MSLMSIVALGAQDVYLGEIGGQPARKPDVTYRLITRRPNDEKHKNAIVDYTKFNVSFAWSMDYYDRLPEGYKITNDKGDVVDYASIIATKPDPPHTRFIGVVVPEYALDMPDLADLPV